MFVYVGTYTEPPNGHGEGIYIFRFDASSGALTPIEVVSGIVNPSFLATTPDGRYLYAVSEIDEGQIVAYSRDERSGELTLLNRQPTHGASPCYVGIDAGGNLVYVANYNGGNIAAFPLLRNGRLNPATSVIAHEGSSINPRRQGEPHPHMIAPSPDDRFVLATDLGTDRVMIYEVDLSSGDLRPNTQGAVSAEVPKGAGPRHFAFSPTGRVLYVINELSSTVTVFSYDHDTANLTALQTLSTLPDNFSGESYCAHILVSPDGRFVYGSNRYHDSLAIFAVNAADGTLSPITHEPTRGKTPRNFAMDPSSTWLLAANQESDTIVPFRRDLDSGMLTAVEAVTSVPSPVAILFLPEPGE